MQRQSATIKNEKVEKRNISNATISVMTSNVSSIVADYTFWDDMVNNIVNPDKTWFLENIDQLPATTKVNYAWVFNLKKELVNYTTDSAYRDLNTPLPYDYFNKVFDVEVNGKKRLCHYFIKDSSNIIEVFGSTVHKTDDPNKVGKAYGYFFLGKVWNKSVLDKLSHIIDCKINEVTDTNLVDTKDKVIVFKTLSDYKNEPATILQFTASLDFINGEKKYSVLNFVIFGIIVTLIFLLSTLFVNTYISRPLKIITSSLRKEDRTFISKLSSKKDEFGGIAKLISRFFLQKEKLIEEIKQRKIIQDKLNNSNLELEQRNQEINQKNVELVIAKEKAEKSDRLKSAFLANMSHEIRTPMNAILGFSELMAEPNIAEDKRNDYINIIQNSGNQLMYIINDLIDISKIEANSLKVEMVPVNINQLLSELFKLFRTKITNDTKFSLLRSLTDNESNLLTDPSRLHQILSNLIGNAIKFTHEGYIKFGYKVKGSDLEFFVEDTGIGLSKDDQQIIFERFGQVEQGVTRVYGGTGLGLPITRELVSLLGGTLWLTSEIKKGTTFYFTIPYKPVVDEQIVENPKPETREIIPGKRRVILVADDEEINFYLLKEQLSGFDIDLIWAQDGKQAVNIAHENTAIDLVLMDIKMPFMDGYHATQEIKKKRSCLPIIMQSAFAQDSYIDLATQAGCDGYISKPFSSEKIINLLNQYIKD